MTDKGDYEENPTGKKTGAPRKIPPAAKAFRATTALVVFGLPLAVGACAVIGYGVRQAFRRIRKVP